MESISAWAAVICVCAAVCTIVSLISPSGNLGKIMGFVLGLFMLCALIIPLNKSFQNIALDLSQIDFSSFSDKNSALFNDKISKQTEELGKESVKRLTENILKKEKISARKIEVITDIDEDNSISIVLVKVYIDRSLKDEKIKIKKLLSEQLSLNIDVQTV